MKRPYGRQSLGADYELTCVEPGQPDGRADAPLLAAGLARSTNWRDLPQKEKLLCEDIVVFRDKKGAVGALDLHCGIAARLSEWPASRRGDCAAAITAGSYDTQGQCIDMPCETEEFRNAMYVWQPAYRRRNMAGLSSSIWARPGIDRCSLASTSFDPDRRRGLSCCAGLWRLRGRDGQGLNWLQHYENIVDPYQSLDSAPVD